jgi:multidrug efflux pump subunit AcrA (membrane-fusion protein)
MHIVQTQLQPGRAGATWTSPADRIRRRVCTFLLYGTILPVSFFSLTVSGCKSEHAAEKIVPTASVALVTRGNLASTLTVAGAFQPYQEVDLHAKVSGFVRRINVDIGDKVKSGEVLAVLEIPELNAQVSAAQAHVKHSESEITRMQSEISLAEANYAAVHAEYIRLSDASKQRPGLIAEQELDDARARDQDALAKINVAKASTDSATQQLGISRADRQRVQSLEDSCVFACPYPKKMCRTSRSEVSLISP